MTVTVSEREAKELVASFGVAVASERHAADADAAVSAARELGFPVVAKLNGPGLAHKTERGLVRLDLRTEADVRDAAAELLGAALPSDGAVDVLIASMVSGSRELIAGARIDEQFGGCVMLGIGGILAEALNDVVLRLAPISMVDALDMIDELRAQPLLGPCRGEPAVDRAALADVLLALSRIVTERPDVMGVELNPLVVSGGLPIAVDALVELRA